MSLARVAEMDSSHPQAIGLQVPIARAQKMGGGIWGAGGEFSHM